MPLTRRHALSTLAAAPCGLWLPRAFATAPPALPAVLAHHGALVHASYGDTRDAAVAMQQRIRAFLDAPSPATLDAARSAWLAAREGYGQTEAYRFYGGPIDDERGPEGQLNAWPMDEAYVDAVSGRPNAGLVNDRRFAITKKSLAAANERGGEENVATGWHAIEFMLWGPDTSAEGPGQRPPADFIDGRAPNADRRRLYLATVTELLLDDLALLVRAWAPAQKGNYRARFERGGLESLRKLFVGLGSLSRGELAGERLEVALASQDQEDEHSCFSDNTHRDAVNNAVGVRNVWLGEWKRPDGSVLAGASPRALVAAKDAALAERTTAQIAESVRRLEALQPPFDREIMGGKDAPGRLRIEAAVASLMAQSRLLVDAAAAAGVRQLALVNPKK
jgi:putative iron-regulated protein